MMVLYFFVRGGNVLVNQFKYMIKEHLAANSNMYLFLLMAFILGVSAGAFTVNGLSTMQRDELSNYFQGFFQLFNNQNMKSGDLFAISLLENLKLIGLLWVLGVSIIGLPFIFIVLGVRGFITGFSSGFIIHALGIKGLLFSGFILLPKEIVIIPCLIAIGVNGINFSLRIAKNKSIDEIQKSGLKTAFVSYCLVTVLFSTIILAGILFDAYITPIFLRMILQRVTI